MWPLDQKPRVILSHWASVYNIKALYNGFKNAVYFTQNLRISGEAIYFSRLILRLSKRFICLSGIATHESVENASERLKMALNRMFWLISNTFTTRNLSMWRDKQLDRGSTPLSSTKLITRGCMEFDSCRRNHVKCFDIKTNGNDNIVDYTGLKEAAWSRWVDYHSVRIMRVS